MLTMRVSWLWGIVMLLSLPVTAQNGNTEARSLEEEREIFLRASSELKTGAGPAYRRLLQDLDDYPLIHYLEYDRLVRELHGVSPAAAREFLKEVQATPLHDNFLHSYLQYKGRTRHWREFLAIAANAPKDTELQCYYYRAKRSAGDTATAWSGAEQLWNVGKSQHDACDPLFERWMIDGDGPSDDLIWSRALRAFDRRSPHLISYVSRFASDALKPLLEELAEVYRRPDRLVNDSHTATAAHAQLVTVGIRRLARINPAQGRAALERVKTRQPLSDQQVEAIEEMIVRHSLFAESAPAESWVIDGLSRLRNDELTEIYLREQVAEGQWLALLRGLDWLSSARRDADIWRYWQARAIEASGSSEQAQPIYAELAAHRSFHGFLAAKKMGSAYQLIANDAEVEEWLPSPHAGKAVDRIVELAALNRWPEARAEWFMMISTLNADEQRRAMHFALGMQWFDLSIATSIRAGALNDMAARFPPAFEALFGELSLEKGVAASELMAIARRESAMYPSAESGAGAVGLMQVMPGTGRQVAKKLGLPWRRAALRDPDYNARIASHYYRTLLDRFDQNRPMALAGYNAGPHRVERWRREMSADQWIESLPFKETRDYVQAVLAYTVIYDLQSGREPDILRPHEEVITPG